MITKQQLKAIPAIVWNYYVHDLENISKLELDYAHCTRVLLEQFSHHVDNPCQDHIHIN